MSVEEAVFVSLDPLETVEQGLGCELLYFRITTVVCTVKNDVRHEGPVHHFVAIKKVAFQNELQVIVEVAFARTVCGLEVEVGR